MNTKTNRNGQRRTCYSFKEKRTTALSAVSHKHTDITKLMNDRNNLNVVKTELTQFDMLCQQFTHVHDLFLNELEVSEDRQRADEVLE